MYQVPFDPEHPPEEPPPAVPQPMLWRLARRLYADHQCVATGSVPALRCRTCGEPWPCRGRRLAERGLVAACRPARSRHLRDRRGPVHPFPADP